MGWVMLGPFVLEEVDGGEGGRVSRASGDTEMYVYIYMYIANQSKSTCAQYCRSSPPENWK
jgi:hypothetical protein